MTGTHCELQCMSSLGDFQTRFGFATVNYWERGVFFTVLILKALF